MEFQNENKFTTLVFIVVRRNKTQWNERISYA